MDFNARQNYAAALSDCWNNNLGVSEQPLITTQTQASSCLLCSNLVLLNQTDYGYSTYVTEGLASANRSKMLKNLCFHMKISDQNIPSECPRSISPLCIACEDLTKQLWRCQGILERIGFEISKIVTRIEKTVVDEEILKTQINRAFQSERLIPLKELILDEYRNKLLKRKQMRSNGIFRQGADNFNSIFQTRQRIQDSIRTSPSASASYSGRSGRLNEIREPEIQNNNTQEVGERREIYAAESCSSLSSTFIPHEDTYERPSAQQDGTENECYIINNNEGQDETFSLGSQMVETSNKEACDLVISDVRSDNSTILSLLMTQIKPEIHSTIEESEINQARDFNITNEMNLDADDILSVEPRQRRLLCEGVEIYKCFDANPGSKTAYLQCSLCNLTLAIPRKVVAGVATPLTKMRRHVREAHEDKIHTRGQSKTRRMLLSCPNCPQKFRGKSALHEHTKSHALECDICGRPIPGNSMRNLVAHKFSHKNDEERKAALAANERGTRMALLSGKIRKNRNVRGRKWDSILRNPAQNLTCNICNRSFPRKNYLQLHMKSHKGILKPSSFSIKPQTPVLQSIFETGSNI